MPHYRLNRVHKTGDVLRLVVFLRGEGVACPHTIVLAGAGPTARAYPLQGWFCLRRAPGSGISALCALGHWGHRGSDLRVFSGFWYRWYSPRDYDRWSYARSAWSCGLLPQVIVL